MRVGRISTAIVAALAVSAAILAAALLTPPVNAAATALGIVYSDQFLRTFRRLLVAAVAVAILAVFRPWRDGSLASYGVRRGERMLHLVGMPYVAALGVIVAIVLAQLSLGYLGVRDPIDWNRLAFRAGWYLIAGLVIGFLEELFFRGWMIRRLGLSMTPLAAAVISSGVYSFLHAFNPRNVWVEVPHDWIGCLIALRGWLSAAGDVARFGGMFVGLFVVGMLFSMLRLRTGSILPAVAGHAAGIFGLYTYNSFTYRIREGGLIGTNRLYDGLLFWVVILIVTALVATMARVRVSASFSSADASRTRPQAAYEQQPRSGR